MVAMWLEMNPTAAELVDHTGSLILELDKFIYGLKQSPAKFQEHLNNVLINIGYMQLAQDSCLYIKHANGHFSVLSLYVDNILQATTNIELYKELQRALINAYGEVTVQPEATSYLGMTITRSHCKGYVRSVCGRSREKV
jgi:hypothetical protein